MSARWLYVAWAVLVLLVGSEPVRAQGTSGLTGTITDSSGAVVPEAQVTLTNVATGFVRTATTSANGIYVFPQIPPATYKLEVRASGFKTAVRERVDVLVGLATTLDIQLEVGELAQIVEVTGETAALNTQDSSLGTPFNERQVRTLPLEARSIVGLLSLQTGAVFLPTGDIRSGSISGSRSDQANITLDGVDVNDAENQTIAYESSLRMTLDSTQEFRTTTTNYGAELGRSSGAQVQLVTKSGTNELHGSLYWYHRNTATSSNEYFNKLAQQETPKLNKHIFGGSAGGPIVKDRFFLFGNYEGLRESSAQPALRNVPSDSFRDGVLIYECADPSLCPGGTVAGLTTNHAVPAGFHGLTPAESAAIDPLGIGPNLAGMDHFRLYPSPNDPGRDGLNLMSFRFTAPIKNDFNTFIARADLKLDSAGKHTLFWRGTLQDDTLNSAPQFPGQPANSQTLINNKGMGLGYDAILRPNLINIFRWGYTRIKDERAGLQTDSLVSFDFISDLPAATSSTSRRVPAHNFRDDLTWVRGSHSFQFGVNVRYTRIPRVSNATSFHRVEVDAGWLNGLSRTYIPGRSTCTTPGCSAVPAAAGSFSAAWASAITAEWGLMTRGLALYNYDRDGSLLPIGELITRRYAANEYEWYVQDVWRIRPTLTVTLGLRHSLFSPPWETDGKQVAPVPGFTELFEAHQEGMVRGIPSNAHPAVTYDLAGPANNRPGFYPWDKNNFAPRVAAAWNPHFRSGTLGRLFGDGKTVFRGGYALVYDRIGLALANTYDTGGSGTSSTVGSGAFGFSSTVTAPFGLVDESTAPRFTGVNDLPGAPVIQPAPPGGFPATPPRGGFIVSHTIEEGLATPYAHLFDFSIGRELPADLSFEVGYVGRRGRRLLARREEVMILDLVDPDSGMSYYEAGAMLAAFAAEGDPIGLTVGRNTADVPPIPYWENLFPGAAGNPICDIHGLGAAATATQVAYDAFLCVAGDYATAVALLDLDILCVPFGTCSRFGPFAYFSDQFCCLGGQSTIGFSEYHSLQLAVRKRYSHGLQFDFNYTLSKSLDITSDVERGDAFGNFESGGLTNYVVDSWNPRKQYSFSDFDVRHQVNANGFYELPFGRGKAFAAGVSGWANQIIGNWQIAGLFRWTSGFPFNVTGCGTCFPTNQTLVGNAELLNNVLPETSTTRNAVDGFPSPFADPSQARTFFRPARPGEVGLRNVLRGDGYFEIDLAVDKSFLLPLEGHRLRFRWETFNVTNTPSFDTGSVSATIDVPASFGRYNRSLASCDGSAGRCMQFSLRYEF